MRKRPTLASLATVAVASLAAAGAAVVLPQPAAATTCSTAWGTQAKQVTNNNHGALTAVRAGRHDCYDRLVLDVSRTGLGYRVTYVRQVHAEGSGAVVPLRGGAFLQVVDQSQASRKLPMPNVAGYTTFRQVGWGGSFEGYTTLGLGVRTTLPFRVFTTGNHLVIDVAHHV